jgi:hemoglobin
MAWGGPSIYSELYGNESFVVRLHSGNDAHDEMDRRAIECFEQVGLTDPPLRGARREYFAWATNTTMGAPRWSWDGLRP